MTVESALLMVAHAIAVHGVGEAGRCRKLADRLASAAKDLEKLAKHDKMQVPKSGGMKPELERARTACKSFDINARVAAAMAELGEVERRRVAAFAMVRPKVDELQRKLAEEQDAEIMVAGVDIAADRVECEVESWGPKETGASPRREEAEWNPKEYVDNNRTVLDGCSLSEDEMAALRSGEVLTVIDQLTRKPIKILTMDRYDRTIRKWVAAADACIGSDRASALAEGYRELDEALLALAGEEVNRRRREIVKEFGSRDRDRLDRMLMQLVAQTRKTTEEQLGLRSESKGTGKGV